MKGVGGGGDGPTQCTGANWNETPHLGGTRPREYSHYRHRSSPPFVREVGEESDT